MYRLCSVLALVACAHALVAQYHLDEAGPQLVAGVALPIASETVKLGPSAGIGGFYTHYRCGKRDGYWIEANARYLQTQDQAPDSATLATPVPPTLPAEANTYRFIQGEVGVYYKIRKDNYHRPREFALLVGPKLTYNLAVRNQEGAFETDSYREVRGSYLGLHLSVFYRLPAGTRYSFLISAGGDYQLAEVVSTTATPRYRYANLYLRFGYTLWNSR
ncbi:MAG: hypothetical protein SFY70_04335 [Bacteroidia bacterium]|nr:hypothetical protein [Bacteroidia bacterium]